MKIRELIDRLEELDRTRNSGAHPNRDNIDFELEFDDPRLDELSWDIELIEVEHWLLPGCGCEADAVIKLRIKEI